jgi:hypothetical protein
MQKMQKPKFVELTEIVEDGIKSLRRTIAINPDKIQCAYGESSFRKDKSTGYTIIQMRRENIKVEESYDDVLAKINIQVPF